MVDTGHMTTGPTYMKAIGDMTISRKPIALDLATWSLKGEGINWSVNPEKPQKGQHWIARISVIAVRGSARRPKVTLGEISGSYVIADWRTDEVPQTPADFMAGWDNRYGVNAKATWDGGYLWTESGEPAEIARVHTLLVPILENLPTCPTGYDGWWLQPRRTK